MSSSTLKVGDRIPSGLSLYENNPGNKVSVDELIKGKRVAIFGVPGAFTPGCSKTHLPGFVADAEKIKSKGISEIVCIAVNDPFVMAAWGEAHQAGGKVRMLADTTAEFSKALGVDLDLTAKLGSVRCKRFSLIADDGVITQLNVEPENEPTGLTCSLASALKL